MKNRLTILVICAFLIIFSGGGLIGLIFKGQADAGENIAIAPGTPLELVLAVQSEPSYPTVTPGPTPTQPVIMRAEVTNTNYSAAPRSLRDDTARLDYSGRPCELFPSEDVDADVYWYLPPQTEVFGPGALEGTRAFTMESGEMVQVAHFYWLVNAEKTFRYVTNCPWVYQGIVGDPSSEWGLLPSFGHPGYVLHLIDASE